MEPCSGFLCTDKMASSMTAKVPTLSARRSAATAPLRARANTLRTHESAARLVVKADSNNEARYGACWPGRVEVR